MKDFHSLKVWQRAHQLTLAVYQITATLPREELYGLTSQLRRSCSSIAANLAEGCGRNGDALFTNPLPHRCGWNGSFMHVVSFLSLIHI